MDLQATMMNNTGGAFQAAGNLPFNIAEIWPFPINAGASNLNRDHLIPLNDPMFVDQRTNHGGRLAKKQREDDELAQGVSTSGNGLSESDSKRLKATGSNENEESRGDGEGNSVEQPAKPVEAHKGYIHVRARRGQATDSHSLAERARREKIGERMKTLQDLVPGCSKVIGKALVLDEIINYVQSLQRQVEFLSMKIEAVNSKVTQALRDFRLKILGSKHSRQMPWHMVHKLQGNMLEQHHQIGYICRLVVDLKEQHNNNSSNNKLRVIPQVKEQHNKEIIDIKGK